MQHIRKLKKTPLFLQIFIGMLVGVLTGYIFMFLGWNSVVSDWIKPIGTIFIKLLKLIAVPMVFISLIKGIVSMKDLSKLSKMGASTIAVYILTTIFAVTLGLLTVSIVKPGKVFSNEKAEHYKSMYIDNITEKEQDADQLKENTVMDFVVNIVPDNIISAGADNSKMLQIIFIAALIGISMVIAGHKNISPLLAVVDSLDVVILKLVEIIMKFAPIGVWGLLAGLIVDFSGDKEMFSALGLYALTVILSLIFLLLIFYPTLIYFFTKIKIKDYLKGIFPVQLLAFSTSSSSATLPFTMEQVQTKLKVKEEVASFVLPLGATINMDGTSCYQSIAIIFIAQIFGIELTAAQMLSIVFLTVMASIGTPGIPGGSIVMTAMVMSSVGIPIEGLALIIGIDRPLDMLRTAVNVTGDSFVAAFINERNK